MRILHLGKYFPPAPGGMEVFLADLVTAQVKHHEVACLVHQDRRNSPEPTPQLKLFTTTSYGHLLYTPVAPGWPSALRHAIKKFRPDVLHIHLPNPVVVSALLLPSARRLPWVVHWHSDVDTVVSRRSLRAAYSLYRWIEKRILARAAAIIATSPDYAATSRPLQACKDRTLVIPLGIDPRRLDGHGSLREKSRQAEPLKLLALGRLSHYKGFDVLLQAIAPLQNVSLCIIGDGEERGRLVQMMQQLGLAGRVQLLGHVAQAELNRRLASCDVVCLPSVARAEAFGMTLLEAMVFGKPVIASNLAGSGMPWVVKQAGHGVLAEPGDIPSLQKAIRTLMDDDLRLRLGERGKKALASDFQIAQVAERIDELYRAVLERPGA